jgi:hypothetical protein
MIISSRRAAGALAVGAALCLSASSVVPAQAGPAAASGWHLAEVYGTGAQSYDPSSSDGLAVGSRSSAWMVWGGCTWPCDTDRTVAVVEHWNGRRWAPVPASKLHKLSPENVVASSPADAWLFGSVSGDKYLAALHWNGTTWSRRSVPDWLVYSNGSGETDLDIADFSGANLWIFSLGYYIGQKVFYASHYQHGRWTKVILPDVLFDVAAISAHDIWALGVAKKGTGLDVMMHWNGSKWSTSAIPKQPTAGQPYDLMAIGPRDLWMGWQPAKAGASGYLLHWNGARWAKVAFPRSGTGSPAAGDGHGGLWVSGFAPGRKRVQLFLHWSAGRWTTWRVPNGSYSPGNVDELALIPAARSLWAIGNVYGPGGGTVLNRVSIWHYAS